MITLATRPASRRQLDECGIWIFWRDHPGGGGRQGFAFEVWACEATDCPCEEVVGRGRWLDDRVARLRATQDDAALQFHAGDGRVADDPSWRDCTFRWHRGTGKVGSEPGPAHDFAALAAWLEAEFDDEVRAAIDDAVARDRHEAARDPWADWQPGDLVSFAEHFPDEAFPAIPVADTPHLVEDLHCIMPACSCTDVRFVVSAWPDEGEPRFAGSFVVTLPGLTPRNIEPADPDAASRQHLISIWRQLAQDHPGLAKLLRRRRERMKQLVPPARPRKRPAIEAMRLPPTPSRNARCPCNSGRKFKNCCGAG